MDNQILTRPLRAKGDGNSDDHREGHVQQSRKPFN